MAANSNIGQLDWNQKGADELFMKLRRMYDNAELPNQHTGRQIPSQANGAQDDTMSHRSVPHSTNETNTVVSASHMHPREKTASMLAPSQVSKLSHVATNSGSRMVFGMRSSNGMAQDQ